MSTVKIRYANGSFDYKPFPYYTDAVCFCRSGISYSGGRVARVEIIEGDSTIAIWDNSWDAVSQAAGLRNAH